MLSTFKKVPDQQELQSMQAIASIACSSPHWRKVGGGGTSEEITATILSIMLFARELGFTPLQAISGGIHNIQGKFEISARLMNQAIRKRGHRVQVNMLNNDVCKIWGQRKDTLEEMEVTYHIEEAIRAGLVKDGGVWKKSPQDMLFARAISRLARRLFPDCIGECYVEGELQETIKGTIVESIDVSKQLIEELRKPLEGEELILPEGISKERVEVFIAETADKTIKSVKEIKDRAVKNIDKFLERFKEWEKQNSSC